MEEKTKEKSHTKFWQKLKNFFIKAGNASLDILFPKDLKCIFCGNDVPDFENKPYCEECEKKEIFNNGHRCKFCDNPIHGENDVCDNCKQHKNLFQKAFCPFLYNDTVRHAVLRFKDDYGKYLTKTFAKYIVEEIQKANITIDIIIPVPTHKKTYNRRGYNQAELLANEIGKTLNVEVDAKLVLKTKYTGQQKKLSYTERQRNLFLSYEITNKSKLKNKNVLIVDDVLTTCATVNAVAALFNKQANNIYVATIARRDLKDSKRKK